MALKEFEIEKLKKLSDEMILGVDADPKTFDFEYEIDRDLDYEENKNILKDKINQVYPRKFEQADLKQMEKENTEQEKLGIEKAREESNKDLSEDIMYLEQCNFVIIGKKGSAKTTLAWCLTEKVNRLSKRKVYVFNHPRPELLKKLPFEVTNVRRLDALFNITDGVVLIDESHEVFNVLDKRVNEDLKILLSHSRQNNTDFIFICHNSYFVNRSLFSFVDARIIKEVNEKHWELERPHMKKLYEDVHIFGKEGFFIDSDYVKGYKTFKKPEWWNEELSNAYRTQNKMEDFFV